MKRTLTILLLVAMPFVIVNAQSDEKQSSLDWQKSFYLEGGMIYPEGVIKESVSIRQNISYYYVNQYSDGYVSSATSGLVLGARYGYFVPRYKTGISAGIRYIGLDTDISGYTSDISDFFFLRYSEEGSDTRFARVKALTESRHMLTIPFELRVEPVTYRNIKLYVKAGIEYSIFNLKNETNIEFRDELMDENREVILASISEPKNKHFSTFYSAVGMKIGRDDRPNLLVEVNLPSLFLTKQNFALIDVDYYEGFKMCVQIPLNN